MLPGEDPALALAEDTARRAALDAALEELEEGRHEPSVEWRRDYSLLLGLERLLVQEEPHLADGTLLNPHQVDALSGTLIALISEIEAAVRLTELLTPGMRERRSGAVVFVSSISGLMGLGTEHGYVAMKAALIAAGKTLAV